MRKLNKRGFTLIELLVVVAIIAILAAIALPQFANYRKRAYDSAASSDLRTTLTVLESYYTDNGAYTTASADPGNASSTSTLSFGTDWQVRLSKGVKVSVAARADAQGNTNQSYCAESAHYSGTQYFQAWAERPSVQGTKQANPTAQVDGNGCGGP